MFVCTIYVPGACIDKKRVSDPLRLQLTHCELYVGNRNRTQVLWKITISLPLKLMFLICVEVLTVY